MKATAIFAGAAALLAASATAALAQRRIPERKPMTDARQQAMERYDTNRNGKIDPDERERMRADALARVKEAQARIYSRYDTNGNRILDPQEKKAIEADRQQLKQFKGAALRRYDTNRNGRIDPAEKQRQDQERESTLQWLNQQILARYDLNRNGKLDPDEKAALEARQRELRSRRPPTIPDRGRRQ